MQQNIKMVFSCTFGLFTVNRRQSNIYNPVYSAVLVLLFLIGMINWLLFLTSWLFDALPAASL